MDIRCLKGHLNIMKVILFQYPYMPHRRVYHRLRCRMAVLLKEILLKRPCINSYPDRDSPLFCGFHNILYSFFIPYIPGIEPQTINSLFHGQKGQFIIKVYICYERDLNGALDAAKGLCCLFIRHSHPHYLASPPFKALYLCYSGINIPGIRIGHGLDNNRRIPAYEHVTNPYLPRLPASNHELSLFKHPQYIVVGDNNYQGNEQGKPNGLSDLHGLFAQGTPFDLLYQEKDHPAAV